MASPPPNRAFLKRYAGLSIATAIFTMGLKIAAYLMTGSVGLLSDALESLVNLVGAGMAFAMLGIAARPADEDHAYGHEKAEYFSSVLEGTLILVAASGIAVAAVRRLATPVPLERVGVGLAVSAVAALANLGCALLLFRVGTRHRSITLEANARHLLTDVWTTAGVVLGVGAVAVTGWLRLDPLIALAVAGQIVWSGVKIVRESASGLMDSALPEQEQKAVREALERFGQDGIEFHALRTRKAGARRFVSLHVLVPGDWSVNRGHAMLERIEAEIQDALPSATVFTHLESLDDPSSWDDQDLDRNTGAP